MIDTHCHLEQKDFEKDRDEVIKRCKQSGIKAIITCCAHPEDFHITMQIVEKYKGYVFATVGIHPEYIKEISEEKTDEFMKTILSNKDKIIGIGEVGLDYNWVKEISWNHGGKSKKTFSKNS